MYQRKQRRFRRRPNSRNHLSRSDDVVHMKLGSNSFSNGHSRNNFRPTLSPEKLFEKYTTLAKEAMTSGDKTLSENYLQHADHFMRIIEDRNRNRNQNKVNDTEKKSVEERKLSENNTIDQNPITKDKDKE